MTGSIAIDLAVVVLLFSAIVSIGYWNWFRDKGTLVDISCDVLGVRTFNTTVPAEEFVEITDTGVVFRRAVYRTRDNEVCVYQRRIGTIE